MNASQILDELVSERDRINRAIEALSSGQSKPASNGRTPRTQEQRQAQAEKMRAYWAARKAGKKTKAARSAPPA